MRRIVCWIFGHSPWRPWEGPKHPIVYMTDGPMAFGMDMCRRCKAIFGRWMEARAFDVERERMEGRL